MAIREIIKKGDSLLTKKAHDVTVFDQKLHTLIDDMKDTLNSAYGVGLAAPQIGILRRIAVINTPEGEWFELVNPEIISSSGALEDVEGCLSIPHTFGIVERPETITVLAQDRFGKYFEHKAEGYTARIFCHEIDHLNGILFTQKVIRYVDPDKEKR
ncbi:MAG: peptide deformylase [Clostridiales bacterium]|nr:peptide deformylase [Clostridiales bacterium]